MTQATTVKRGPYARSHQRRQTISQAVLALIDEVGHDGVTTALVSERSRTNEATVLYHYPTKDHLLVAALERADEVKAGATGAEDPDIRLDPAVLRETANLEILENERRVRLYQMMRGQAATPGHPAAEYFTRRNVHAVAIYTRLIKRRQADGLAHPSLDPRLVAQQFLALWEGLGNLSLHDPSLDVGSALVDGLRRLSGENWMSAVNTLTQPESGL
jgi:AcrR family transcriptional regulator